MRKNLPWIVLGVIAYFAYRKWQESRTSAVTAAAQTMLPEGGYSVAPPTFKAEWAGSELYKQTGSVLPSGAAREMIR